MTWADATACSVIEALSDKAGTGGVAVAVAAADPSGPVTRTSPGGLPPAGRFEIGSVTKTMTAAVLACLTEDGVLSLDDQIGRWLNAGANGEITVRQLATHTSGLPSRPPNLPVSGANPWAGYTFDRAEEGLRRAELTAGRPWRYSNLGYQLLGLVLERATGREYPALMAGYLLAPLAMTQSGVGGRGDGVLLPGHTNTGEAVQWDHPWGAGGVEATIADLARYATACLFPPRTPLGAAIALAQRPVIAAGDGTRQALAWIIHDGDIAEHSGATGGFSACVTVDHGRGRAVAVLASYGGSLPYVSQIKNTVRLALAGEDPRRARRPEPWPAWREDVQEAVRALLTGRVNWAGSPSCRKTGPGRDTTVSYGPYWALPEEIPRCSTEIPKLHHCLTIGAHAACHAAGEAAGRRCCRRPGATATAGCRVRPDPAAHHRLRGQRARAGQRRRTGDSGAGRLHHRLPYQPRAVLRAHRPGAHL
jgi:CubicO group peptidase (beta-lactamase class C family)